MILNTIMLYSGHGVPSICSPWSGIVAVFDKDVVSGVYIKFQRLAILHLVISSVLLHHRVESQTRVQLSAL